MTSLPAPMPSVPRAKPAAAQWVGPNMPLARWGLILNLFVPVALLVWDAKHGALGANAAGYAIHTTGWLAVMLLLLSLAVTPLRQATGFAWLVQFRRSLGVYAFYYAFAHLAIYFWFEQGRSVGATVSEITHRWYLAVGFTSLALMVPLWATSFNAAIRRMGGKKWKLLHRLAYVSAVLAGVHYYMQSKSDKTKPTIYLSALGVLLLWRVGALAVARVRTARRAKSAAANRTWKGDLRVAEMVKETPTVTTFRLFPTAAGDVPLTWMAGQYLNLAVDIDGKRVSRSYTIASPPTRKDHLELTIKRETDGNVSRFLHDKLMNGDTIGVSGPAGKFTFDPKDEKAVLLIAGGVGVTPVMSIFRDLVDRKWPGRIDFVFSVHTPADVIFADELKKLGERANVNVHLTCTRDAPAAWPGDRGRIDAGLIRRRVPDFKDRRAYVCGPDAMAAAVCEQLKSAGVPADRIVLESFTPAPAKTAAAGRVDGQAVTLTFSQSNATTQTQPGQTILDAAEAAGVDIPYVCRSGVCGTCKCKLVDGDVTQNVKDALSESDEADGYILTCQSYANSDVTIEA